MGYKADPNDPSPFDFDEDEEGSEFAEYYRRDRETDIREELEEYQAELADELEAERHVDEWESLSDDEKIGFMP